MPFGIVALIGSILGDSEMMQMEIDINIADRCEQVGASRVLGDLRGQKCNLGRSERGTLDSWERKRQDICQYIL